MIEAASETQQARNAPSAPHATGEPPPPPDATPAADAQLTPSALRCVIGYLACNAVPGVHTNHGTLAASPVAGALDGPQPCLLAESLFSAAAQAPSSYSAAAASAAAAATTSPVPATPTSVTRPLALLAASPRTRRELECHLVGGCALPPLGALVLQVQAHIAASPPSARGPARDGAASHAERWRRRSGRRRRRSPSATHPPPPPPSRWQLLVSSANVAVAALPFQPARSPPPSAASPGLLPQSTATPPPPSPAQRPPRPVHPPVCATPPLQPTQTPTGRSPVPSVKTPARSVAGASPPLPPLLASPSPVIQSRRLPLRTVTPVDRSGAVTPPVVSTSPTSAATTPHSSAIPLPRRPPVGVVPFAGVTEDASGGSDGALGASSLPRLSGPLPATPLTAGPAPAAVGPRGGAAHASSSLPSPRLLSGAASPSTSTPPPISRPQPPQRQLQHQQSSQRSPPSVPAPLQTLCHALWWVRRGPLPVSLSLLRYKAADVQALWTALAATSTAACEVGGGLESDAREGEGDEEEGAVALSEPGVPAADDSEPSSSRSSSRSADSATVTTPSAGATPAAASLTAPAHSDVNRLPQASARRRTPPPSPASAPSHAASIVRTSSNAATGARRPLDSPVLTPKMPPAANDVAHPRAGGATSGSRRNSSPMGVTPVRAAGAVRTASPPAAAVPPSSPLLATAAMPHPPFTQLHVHGKAADAALAALLLPAHPEVRTLRLTHGTLADTQLEHLARACPDVTHLSLAMNNAIRTTAFLCPTPSDTTSVATTTTLTATTTTTWTATATATTTTTAVPVPASTATPACSAAADACGAGCASPTHLGASQRHPSFLSSSTPLCRRQLHQRDAACAALELSGGSGGGGGGNGGSMSVVGSDNDDPTGDAAGACAVAASVATATVPLSPRSPSWPRRPSALGKRNSQLDLFAPDEEGELEMRLSLWQAAQTDAAERRQPVFILRPQDVVLGHGGGREGAGNRCAVRRESREAAAARAWRRDSAGVLGASFGSVPAPRAPASPSAAALLLAHLDVTRVHLAEALRALSPPRATPSSTPAAAAAGATYHSSAASTATSVHTHTDPHTRPQHNTQQQQQHRASRRQSRAMRPRVGSTSQIELSASLLQHSAPISARSHSVHGTASGDATALQATRPTSPRARDRCRRSRESRDAPAAAVVPLTTTDALHSHRRRHQHTRDGRREAQTTAAAGGVAPRGASADLSARRRRRPHWADTLVDLDLSYTHIPDADAARDVPQLRRLCRLSLEGCMRLAQIAWLPQLTLLRELNLSLSSIHGTALYPLGCCARLVWLKLEGCTSFTAVQQLWLEEEPAPPHALATSTPTPPPHRPPPMGTPNAAAAGGGGVVAAGHAAPGRAVWHSVVSGIPAITVLPPPGGLASVSRAVALRDALALHRGGGASGTPVESAAPAAPAALRSPQSPQAPPPPLLDELRTLIATGTGLTNEGLRKLPEMVGLECLVMDRCPGLSDVGDVAAALPSLHTLDLSRTRVTAEGLAALRHSRTLRQLRLQDCAALTRLPALLVSPFAASTSKATSSSVPPHLPLTALDLSYSKHLAPDGLAGLVAADEAAAALIPGANQEARRPGSRATSVLSTGSGAAAVSTDDVVATPTFSCVRHVLLRACDGLVHLHPLQGLLRVVELDLYHTSVTEATLTSALASWTCLEVLNIASTRVRSLAAWCPSTDASDGASASEEAAGRLPAFAATLRVLVLSNTEVTSDGLAALRHFRRLEVLQLSNCGHLRDLSFLPLAAAAAAVPTTNGDARSAAAAAAAARRRTALTELSVTEATLLTDAAAFPFLASCPSLRNLSLAGCALLCTNGPNTAAEQERGGVVQPAAPVLDGDVGAVGRLTALVELNLSSTGISLTGLRVLLAQGSASASECVAASSLYTACMSLQRLWLRGCRNLDEAALMSAAAAAAAVVRECGGEVTPAPLPPPHRPRLPPQLREVYLSHGRYGAAVLAGVQ